MESLLSILFVRITYVVANSCGLFILKSGPVHFKKHMKDWHVAERNALLCLPL